MGISSPPPTTTKRTTILYSPFRFLPCSIGRRHSTSISSAYPVPFGPHVIELPHSSPMPSHSPKAVRQSQVHSHRPHCWSWIASRDCKECSAGSFWKILLKPATTPFDFFSYSRTGLCARQTHHPCQTCCTQHRLQPLPYGSLLDSRDWCHDQRGSSGSARWRLVCGQERSHTVSA